MIAEESSSGDLETEVKDEETKTIVGQTFTHKGIEVTITGLGLTDERSEYEDKEYEHLLYVEYTLKNNHDEEYYGGYDFELYVDGMKADDYYMSKRSKSEHVSANRSAKLGVVFGFDGEIKDLELELSDSNEYDSGATIINITEDDLKE